MPVDTNKPEPKKVNGYWRCPKGWFLRDNFELEHGAVTNVGPSTCERHPLSYYFDFSSDERGPMTPIVGSRKVSALLEAEMRGAKR